ncbi:hypothetical protein RJ639_042732 [Escallonia herrerae]|uniref:S-locus receptor kinase C-terminal domain-containing protein n=1 Tax=Escallonia herrerae TaxID=1293975 RepID=A0AA88WBD2_9ASTE|nr:hypothetical protein RJ639_024575 [Escallonia herrerae]KAK3023722.1 hypothetical protein RJ639_042732 [Escallonia herrerae]
MLLYNLSSLNIMTFTRHISPHTPPLLLQSPYSSCAHLSLNSKPTELIVGSVSYHFNSTTKRCYTLFQVWDLWREGRALEIADPSLGELYEAHEVLRCIHIGLLCVQEFANDRPSMSEVAFMLCHETTLSSPKQPAFIFKTANAGTDSSSAGVGAVSVCDTTITVVEAR